MLNWLAFSDGEKKHLSDCHPYSFFNRYRSLRSEKRLRSDKVRTSFYFQLYSATLRSLVPWFSLKKANVISHFLYCRKNLCFR